MNITLCGLYHSFKFLSFRRLSRLGPGSVRNLSERIPDTLRLRESSWANAHKGA